MSDKSNLAEFARVLCYDAKLSLVASGGTAKLLRENGLEVKYVFFLTGSKISASKIP